MPEEQEQLQERLLAAWIGINGALKESRLAGALTYNEAVVMKLVYDQYREDGQGRVPVQRILQRTNMLKSLANRTVNALCRKGYLQKARGEKDARSLFVSPVPEQLPAFLAVHRQSLALAERDRKSVV